MLLLIPLKTTANIDLITSLSKWVDTSHPHYSSVQLNVDIKRLHSLRADISEEICTNSSHSYAFDKNRTLSDLLEYHACLVACTQIGFPTCGRDARVNGTIDANLQFSWRNAFDEDEESVLSAETKSHFNYEIVSVLWNIAALLSFKAATMQDWSSKEGLSLVKKEYETAALIFCHIKEILEKTGTKSNAITSDLTNPSLNMCKYLCLAQGQICLYQVLKQKLDTTSTPAAYTLIAQISSGIADFYDHALRSSQDLVIKHNDSSKIYGAHLKSLSMLFKARSEFLQSMVERKSAEHGNELARLYRCRDMIREAIDFTKSNGKQCAKVVVGPSSLGKSSLDVLRSLRETVKQRLIELTKSNDTIYHERVPTDNMLSKIIPKDMISCNITSIDTGRINDLPKDFLPDSLLRPMFASISTNM